MMDAWLNSALDVLYSITSCGWMAKTEKENDSSKDEGPDTLASWDLPPRPEWGLWSYHTVFFITVHRLAI